MTRLLLGLAVIAFIALGLSELFGRINAGKIKDVWPGVIFVAALMIIGTVLYVIKTSRYANQWQIVRKLRRRSVRADRGMAKERRTSFDHPDIP